ncbi:antirestriction protein ArdA, partial [uncultured Alistipes sp.]|uniref:antirestriction protein ArdA n=1 Tax=uncultured Alistipes sp. TaxID=538949 RepID=UPI0032201996
NLAQNLDCYWIYPAVRTEADYGYYLIDELDELELPEEAKKYFKYEEYGVVLQIKRALDLQIILVGK